MFSGSGDAGTPGAAQGTAPSLDDLRDALASLAAHDGAGLTEAELVDHLTVMEQLKAGLAAAQARVTAHLAAQRGEERSRRGGAG